ncbi:hypothetical protein MycrhN_3703 [Mycolicibacterium rhodesiae NBB3]|uniref:DUF4190 domain-containing protein n=1 Tax=Mycolicibacterium rhodesiae (strain NBB3) TaxID=710685 RepID=G8RVH4_MYCRN|nr:DUF4190 domain-containing protein [Mycolicibacterium rhodesiae]AEV74221.1 hypothetical protein MycrhN_3703 [Mycolicibacterium rhodesiae NBB3]
MTIPGQEPGQVPDPNYAQAQGYPPPAQGTNKLAIWSLVTSLLGLLCGVGSIIGIVLGVMAIKQLNRSQEGGRGLATAGIAIGIITLLFILPSTIAFLRN